MPVVTSNHSCVNPAWWECCVTGGGHGGRSWMLENLDKLKSFETYFLPVCPASHSFSASCLRLFKINLTLWVWLLQLTGTTLLEARAASLWPLNHGVSFISQWQSLPWLWGSLLPWPPDSLLPLCHSCLWYLLNLLCRFFILSLYLKCWLSWGLSCRLSFLTPPWCSPLHCGFTDIPLPKTSKSMSSLSYTWAAFLTNSWIIPLQLCPMSTMESFCYMLDLNLVI